MKILCICARGNSRSVALGWILKDVLRQDAIAIGMEAAGEDTKEMLYQWADAIIVVEQQWLRGVPEQYHGKTRLWEVGGDRFFRAYEPELLNLYGKYIYDVGMAPLLHFWEDVPRDGVVKIQATDPEGKFEKVPA